MASKSKTVFCCTECGNETIKWSGKCPACGSWNTLVEVKESKAKESRYSDNSSSVKLLDDLQITDEIGTMVFTRVPAEEEEK